MKVAVQTSLKAYVKSGQANAGFWAGQQRCAQVVFEDASAFFNANTPADLAQLQAAAD